MFYICIFIVIFVYVLYMHFYCYIRVCFIWHAFEFFDESLNGCDSNSMVTSISLFYK